MAQTNTFFKQRDKGRWIKDRFMSTLVKLGGVGVLLALVLMIIYLLLVVMPIFSSATIEPQKQGEMLSQDVLAIGVDDYGDYSFSFNTIGQVNFTPLTRLKKHNAAAIPSQKETFSYQVLTENMTAFSSSMASSGWYAYGDGNGQVVAVKPKFTTVFTEQGRTSRPKLEYFQPQPILLDPDHKPIESLAIAINRQSALLVGQNSDGEWRSLAFELDRSFATGDERWLSYTILLPKLPAKVDDYLITPDAKTLYALAQDKVWILKRSEQDFQLREVVDISQGDDSKTPLAIDLLSGAHSLLVTHKDGSVSQWFDVLKQGQRHFTHIRDFEMESEIGFILPDFYRKGFYSFHRNGYLQSHYTTSEKLVLSKPVFSAMPKLAAMSSNENYLLSVDEANWQLFKVDNPYPEVSFSSLWQKVWYEGYPKPDYVWQSTAASNDFEPKFSLVPIAFGTLKSAFFAMLFAVPIAISGAIYTAYFMSPTMRRYVKPSIELMEALPTVIIGFLAGLWLAPIVEINLLTSLLLIITLPMVIILSALLWRFSPQCWRQQLSNGWLALMLVPIILVFSYLVFSYGHLLEHWLFGGNVRLFLAGIGIDFDQRNALIIGFAMGFAVIPTIFTIAEDAIFSVPKHLSDGASALGATAWQCLTTVVLVTASPGIFSAVMMGLGRAVGETMIVLMATGNTPIMDMNLFSGMRTLAANIAIEMPESEVGSSHFRLLFLAALLLFVFTFVVNSLAELIRQRLRDKYRAL